MKTRKIFSKGKILQEKLFTFKNSFIKCKHNLKNFSFSKIKILFLNTNLLKIPLILSASAFLLKLQQKKSLFQENEFKKVYLNSTYVKKLEDLKEGEFSEFIFGENEKLKILVIKKFGNLYAYNNECSYQNNPLHKGDIIHDKIKCPLHGDTFNIFTGENLIGPSMDDLKKYELKLENNSTNNYYIEVEKSKNFKNKNKIFKKDPQDTNKYIIIGGGVEALSCAKSLRENGFKGEINIISEEKYLPYNKPAISKNIAIDNINKILLKDENFYKDYDINVQLNMEVIFINQINKEIKLSNGVVKVIFLFRIF